MAKLSSSGAARRPKPSQNIGKASSYSKPTGQRKLRSTPAARPAPARPAPARSNAGGAVRGQARAAQVKAMNAAKPKPSQAKAAPASKPKGPTHGSKVSAESRLKARGRVKDPRTGGIYSKRTGQLVNRPASSKAQSAPKSQGISPLDFTPAGLIRRDAQAIKKAVSR